MAVHGQRDVVDAGNVLFDTGTGEALCVVDLDTVMPGVVGHDFGDMVRSQTVNELAIACAYAIMGKVDPLADIEVINTELALADLEQCERACERNHRKGISGDKAALQLAELQKQVIEKLQEGIPVRAMGLRNDQLEMLRELRLLTAKPMMFIANSNIIYALFLGLIISSILLLFVGSIAIRLFRYIAEVPRAVLLLSIRSRRCATI